MAHEPETASSFSVQMVSCTKILMQSSHESEMLCNVHPERNAQTGDVFMVVVKRETSRKFWKNEAKKIVWHQVGLGNWATQGHA